MFYKKYNRIYLRHSPIVSYIGILYTYIDTDITYIII